MESVTTISLIIGVSIALIEVIKYGMGLFFGYLRKERTKGVYDSELDSEVGILKTKMVAVEGQLDKIMNNHLEHIKSDIVDIKVSVAKICTKLGINE